MRSPNDADPPDMDEDPLWLDRASARLFKVYLANLVDHLGLRHGDYTIEDVPRLARQAMDAEEAHADRLEAELLGKERGEPE